MQQIESPHWLELQQNPKELLICLRFQSIQGCAARIDDGKLLLVSEVEIVQRFVGAE